MVQGQGIYLACIRLGFYLPTLERIGEHRVCREAWTQRGWMYGFSLSRKVLMSKAAFVPY